MAREKRPPASPASSTSTVLREVMAAEFRQRADRPGHQEFAGHWRAEAERWESGEAVEVSCWELPPEHRPTGDDYDRYRVGPAGELTLVQRHQDGQAAMRAQLDQRELEQLLAQPDRGRRPH